MILKHDRPRVLNWLTALALLVGVSIFLVAESALAVIVFLKGQDQPIRGYLVRENEHVVVIDQLLSDNTTRERSIAREDIEDIIQTVSQERLAGLQPDAPDAYREYAEELAEKSKDPDARVAAIRLFLIAAQLAPDRLGRSCLLGMVPLARSAHENRRFRAMAYLLDPTHDSNVLTLPMEPTSTKRDVDPRQAKFMLRALQLLRQGNRREALTQARRIKMKERLPQLTDSISFSEFEEACELVCPHCKRGRTKCPTCKGRKFISRKSCTTCGARGDVPCSECGGDYQDNKLPPSLLKRIVQLELDWLPAATAPRIVEVQARPSWSQSVQQDASPSLRPLDLETLTEFDPRKNTFRDGEWVSAE